MAGKKRLPWDGGGLGSCWAIERLHSDRKSCVGFRPVPKNIFSITIIISTGIIFGARDNNKIGGKIMFRKYPRFRRDVVEEAPSTAQRIFPMWISR